MRLRWISHCQLAKKAKEIHLGLAYAQCFVLNLRQVLRRSSSARDMDCVQGLSTQAEPYLLSAHSGAGGVCRVRVSPHGEPRFGNYREPIRQKTDVFFNTDHCEGEVGVWLGKRRRRSTVSGIVAEWTTIENEKPNVRIGEVATT